MNLTNLFECHEVFVIEKAQRHRISGFQKFVLTVQGTNSQAAHCSALRKPCRGPPDKLMLWLGSLNLCSAFAQIANTCGSPLPFMTSVKDIF